MIRPEHLSQLLLNALGVLLALLFASLRNFVAALADLVHSFEG